MGSRRPTCGCHMIGSGAFAVLLLFQAAVYTNGPWAGPAAEGIHLTPIR